jgi:hypothetical protein
MFLLKPFLSLRIAYFLGSTVVEKEVHVQDTIFQKADGIGHEFISWENVIRALNLPCFPLWQDQGS